MSFLDNPEELNREDGANGRKVLMNRKGGKQSSTDVVKIIRTIKERDSLPCIIFSFSRKECEAYASLLKDLDFNTSNFYKNFFFIFRIEFAIIQYSSFAY